MAAARSAAFRYGAADRPPPLDSYGQPLAHNNDDASTKLRLNLALLNRNEGEGLNLQSLSQPERRLPVPAVGDDVDLVSGLRKEQLDAAARRAMIDQKMMRQRGDAGLAKGEVRLFFKSIYIMAIRLTGKCFFFTGDRSESAASGPKDIQAG